MAVTTLFSTPTPDFAATFSLLNRSTPHTIRYGITADGKVYRQRINHDSAAGPGGPGTYVDTGVTVPDVTIVADL